MAHLDRFFLVVVGVSVFIICMYMGGAGIAAGFFYVFIYIWGGEMRYVLFN